MPWMIPCQFCSEAVPVPVPVPPQSFAIGAQYILPSVPSPSGFSTPGVPTLPSIQAAGGNSSQEYIIPERTGCGSLGDRRPASISRLKDAPSGSMVSMAPRLALVMECRLSSILRRGRNSVPQSASRLLRGIGSNMNGLDSACPCASSKPTFSHTGPVCAWSALPSQFMRGLL